MDERRVYDTLSVEIASFTKDEDRKSFLLRDAKAKSIVAQCITGKHLDLLKDASTAKEMMKILKNMFESNSTFSKLHLKRKLLSLKSGQNERLEDFVLKFEHTGDGKCGIQNG